MISSNGPHILQSEGEVEDEDGGKDMVEAGVEVGARTSTRYEIN